MIQCRENVIVTCPSYDCQARITKTKRPAHGMANEWYTIVINQLLRLTKAIRCAGCQQHPRYIRIFFISYCFGHAMSFYRNFRNRKPHGREWSIRADLRNYLRERSKISGFESKLGKHRQTNTLNKQVGFGKRNGSKTNRTAAL